MIVALWTQIDRLLILLGQQQGCLQKLAGFSGTFCCSIKQNAAACLLGFRLNCWHDAPATARVVMSMMLLCMLQVRR